MSPVAVFAAGLLFATAGFIIGASIVERTWHELATNWQKRAQEAEAAVNEAVAERDHYRKLYEASRPLTPMQERIREARANPTDDTYSESARLMKALNVSGTRRLDTG